jgi:hypothetical protein
MTADEQAALLQLAERLITSAFDALMKAHDNNATTAKTSLLDLAAKLDAQPDVIETTLGGDDAVADNAEHDKFPDKVPLETP